MDSIILDVAIGLVFVFLLVSILCSGIFELIAGWLDLRGKMLERGLAAMLAKQGRAGSIAATKRNDESLGMLNKLMEHPLLLGISLDKRKPSFLEPRTFAVALVDVIAREHKGGQWLFDDLAQTVAAMPDGDLKRRMQLIVREARGDAEQAKILIEQWFSDTMDRVSGWYKRQAQLILLGIAVVVAVVMNIDALHIAGRLASDRALRQSVVAQAQAYIEQRKESAPANDASPAIAPTPISQGAADSATDGLDAKQNEIRKDVKYIVDLGLPLGYGTNWWSERVAAYPQGTFWWPAVLLACGWFVTALAATIGAPYWFDILSKLLSIRSSGVKPGAGTEMAGAQGAAMPVQVNSGSNGASGTAKAQIGVGHLSPGWSMPGAGVVPFSSAMNDYELNDLSMNDVRRIQGVLGVAQTGLLTQETRDAVRRFQHAKGLSESGELDGQLVAHLPISP